MLTCIISLSEEPGFYRLCLIRQNEAGKHLESVTAVSLVTTNSPLHVLYFECYVDYVWIYV